MEITRTAHADHSELRLRGRMDAIWSDHVGRSLAECVRAGQHVIAVDMAEVDYISSAGIRVLVLYARQLQAIDGQLTVVNASVPVNKVLQLSGLQSLLQPEGVAPRARASNESGPSHVRLAHEGATAEVYELESGAVLRGQWIGNPTPWLQGQGRPDLGTVVEFPANAMGLGLGAFGGGSVSGTERFGEFLAAAGGAVCQPADGTNKPDYILQKGALTPALNVGYALIARGAFTHLLRFDKADAATSVPLTTIARACLEATRSDAIGMVMIAETASLVGAALQKVPTVGVTGGAAIAGTAAATSEAPANAESPAPQTADRIRILRFPEIRDWLSFSAEAAFANTVSLVVGYAASQAREAGLRLLRPLARSREWYGHFHAAAFSYRPIRKGRVALEATVMPLFDTEHVLGLLHLVNDWREASGAGESRFLRGACWCAPLVMP